LKLYMRVIPAMLNSLVMVFTGTSSVYALLVLHAVLPDDARDIPAAAAGYALYVAVVAIGLFQL
jgi:hypothetical protein